MPVYAVRNTDLSIDLCRVDGTDELDAVAGMLQATGALPDVIDSLLVHCETEIDGGMRDPEAGRDWPSI